MSAGVIKAQGLLLLLHRYRWILPSICIHHGWHVFHGGTAVTGVRQSSIIPGLTVPNLLYCPSSSLRQKFLFLPPPISTKRSKTYSRVFYIVVRASTRFKIIKKIVEDHVSFTLVTILKKKKKKSPLQVSQITVISSGNYPMMSSSVGSRSNALRIATRTNFYSPNSYFYDNPSNERNKKGKCFAKFKNFRIEKASSPIKITCRRSFSSREFWTSLYIYNGGREGGYAKYLKQLKFASWKAELNEATSTIRPEHAILRKPTVLSAEWKTMAILIGDSRASVRTYTHTHRQTCTHTCAHGFDVFRAASVRVSVGGSAHTRHRALHLHLSGI